jgi:hypothetical protein
VVNDLLSVVSRGGQPSIYTTSLSLFENKGASLSIAEFNIVQAPARHKDGIEQSWRCCCRNVGVAGSHDAKGGGAKFLTPPDHNTFRSVAYRLSTL